MLFKFPSLSKLQMLLMQCSAQSDPRHSLEGQTCASGMRPLSRPAEPAEAQSRAALSITEQGGSRAVGQLSGC